MLGVARRARRHPRAIQRLRTSASARRYLAWLRVLGVVYVVGAIFIGAAIALSRVHARATEVGFMLVLGAVSIGFAGISLRHLHDG